MTLLNNHLYLIIVTNLLRNIHSIAMRRSQSTHLLGGGSDGQRSRNPSGPRMRRKSSVRGIIRRTCSIQVDPGEMPGMLDDKKYFLQFIVLPILPPQVMYF